MSAFTRNQNIDRTAERLQNLQHLSYLCCRLAGLKIDNEPEPDASNAGEFFLPQVLLLACASDQGADIRWSFNPFCHHYFPERENQRGRMMFFRR